MSDTTGFSHITVSSDDDDDVVIQAGIADDSEDVASEADSLGPSRESDGVQEVPCEPDAPAAVDDTPTGADGGRVDGADDGYRETTLADIEGSKMSMTQKVVIVVALLGIVAFAAWYLFAR